MAYSNSFLSHYEILLIAQENVIRKIFLFYHEIVCYVYSLELPRRGESNEYTKNNYCVENQNYFLKLSLFAAWPGVTINPQWLELPISRKNFHGPKDVRAIEVWLYFLKHVKRLFLESNEHTQK